MKLNQLDKIQYLHTMKGKMIDVTEVVESFVDVWGYADGENSYNHVLLFGNRANVYVVIVIDVLKECIVGHYILDLNEEYGVNG